MFLFSWKESRNTARGKKRAEDFGKQSRIHFGGKKGTEQCARDSDGGNDGNQRGIELSFLQMEEQGSARAYEKKRKIRSLCL